MEGKVFARPESGRFFAYARPRIVRPRKGFLIGVIMYTPFSAVRGSRVSNYGDTTVDWCHAMACSAGARQRVSGRPAALLLPSVHPVVAHHLDSPTPVPRGLSDAAVPWFRVGQFGHSPTPCWTLPPPDCLTAAISRGVVALHWTPP